MAIKIIDTRKIREEYVRANLHREARIMASLRHPNIIRLYETLKVGDRFCVYYFLHPLRMSGTRIPVCDVAFVRFVISDICALPLD